MRPYYFSEPYMQTAARFIAPETQAPTFDAVLAGNIAAAERDLAHGRVQWERARRRVVALEVVVDHWRWLHVESQCRLDGARRCA